MVATSQMEMEEYLSKKTKEEIIVSNWTRALSKSRRQNQSNVSLKLMIYMHSPKPGTWLLQHEDSGCQAKENPSEETISESSQIRELNQPINL